MKLYGIILFLSIMCMSIETKSSYPKSHDVKAIMDFVDNKLNPKIVEKKLYSERYFAKMAKLESGGSKDPYNVVNKYGYMGKYQFGKKTLKGLFKNGLIKKDYTPSEFIGNPNAQEEAMEALTTHNIEILRNYKLLDSVGKTIDGVEITLDGMLAASHLRGPNAVRLFIRSNGETNLTDGNGTSVKDYMKKFTV
jgi:hypothetical protein